MDALAEIRKIYFSTTRSTIQKDFDRAIDLLKTLPSEEERDKAAVFMEGLAEMRKEFTERARTSGPARGRTRRRG
jgi:hypothetical protein